MRLRTPARKCGPAVPMSASAARLWERASERKCGPLREASRRRLLFDATFLRRSRDLALWDGGGGGERARHRDSPRGMKNPRAAIV